MFSFKPSHTGNPHLFIASMCCQGVRSILSLSIVARDNRCMYMEHDCLMSVVVTVWGSVGMLVV